MTPVCGKSQGIHQNPGELPQFFNRLKTKNKANIYSAKLALCRESVMIRGLRSILCEGLVFQVERCIGSRRLRVAGVPVKHRSDRGVPKPTCAERMWFSKAYPPPSASLCEANRGPHLSDRQAPGARPTTQVDQEAPRVVLVG